MKTLLKIFFTIIISSPLFAQTSVYHPFPDSNAVWREDRSCYQCSSCYGDYFDYQKYLGSDTLIDNFVYEKIFETGFFTCINISGSTTYPYTNSYQGSIRQDSSQRKIFYVAPNDTTDTLLYDFNLYLGDTLPPSYINNPMGDVNIVSSIDSVLVGPTYRKKYGISMPAYPTYPDYVYLIEGIGSTFGLLNSLFPPISFFPTGNLICFIQNGQPLYPDTLNCTLVSVNVFEESANLAFQISPNPTIGIFTIYSDDHSLKKYLLSIYDVFGKRVLNDNISSASPINISSQPNGIYFLQLKDKDGKFFHSKLVLQK